MWLLILYVIPHLPSFFLIVFYSASGLAKLIPLLCFCPTSRWYPKINISRAVNIQQGTLLFWGKLVYVVCQRCDLGRTPLRLREPMKMKNKTTQTNKTKKRNQTNQPTDLHIIPPHPKYLDIFGQILTFPKVFSFALLFCLINLWAALLTLRIHKDMPLFTSGQKPSITTSKYPLKIGTHFKEYFVFYFSEFPMPPQFFLLCLLCTGNMLLSHGTVTYITRSPHIIQYTSNLNSFCIYAGKRVK